MQLVKSVVGPKVGGDQCIAGPGASKFGGDQSHPVPMVFAPISLYEAEFKGVQTSSAS